MSFNESIVEDAALIMPAATLTRPLPWGEEWDLGVGIVKSKIGRAKFRSLFPFSLFTLHSFSPESIQRLNPAIAFRPLATLRDTLLPKLLSGELSTTKKPFNLATSP